MSNQQKRSLFRTIIEIPWTTRTYFFGIILFFCLDYFNQKWSNLHLTSNFFITILGYQVWRGLVNFMYESNIIMLILMITHLGMYLPKFERQNGSVVAFYEILTIGILVQIFVLTYQAAIYLLNDNLITQNWTVTFNVGASGVFINMFYKFLYFNFKQNDNKCSGKTLFTFLYPILLILIGTWVYGQYKIDMITGNSLITFIAYVLAVIQCAFFKGGIIFYSPDTYTQKQKFVYYFRLPRLPLCNWSNLNYDKLTPNNLLVVQAHQFYRLKSFQPVNQKSIIQLTETQMQTQRGVFRNRRNIMEDDVTTQNKGQKWQQAEIVEDD